MILVMPIKKISTREKKVNADSCLTRQNPSSPLIFIKKKKFLLKKIDNLNDDFKNSNTIFSSKPKNYSYIKES